MSLPVNTIHQLKVLHITHCYSFSSSLTGIIPLLTCINTSIQDFSCMVHMTEWTEASF